MFYNKINITLLVVMVLLLTTVSCDRDADLQQKKSKSDNPHIINIINFIRQCEPRIDWITEDVLFETVVEQIKIMKQYKLRGTFLLQYDALVDKRYQKLLMDLPPGQFEIGAWWEIPQGLVENSGYTWRGRYPWDWHADVGFATGYSPEEREKLIDTYMSDFKDIFGYHPKSIGSWFIDAHSLDYMYNKYGIVASCNCKDQIGTDGYTLWGGYWNQAYYPSKKNAYMPAQNEKNQIPVPIFRMLGSDPIHQYDNGLGGKVQRVISLEPVYKGGGGNARWCKWYYDEFINGPCMEYAYTQTGQENSFAWKRMENGFKIQMPLIAKLRDEGKVEIKTLGETGEWFKKNYSKTPPTSVSVLSDHSEKDLKTVWFNSRFYRANLLWEKGTMRFRDIHIFDEKIESDYFNKKGTSTRCNYYTLPLIDGFKWSSLETVAGLRFKTVIADSAAEIIGDDPVIDDSLEGQLTVKWPVHVQDGNIVIKFDESSIFVTYEEGNLENWFLELSSDKSADLPFLKIDNKNLSMSFNNNKYKISALQGVFISEQNAGLRVKPENNIIHLDLSLR